MAKRRNQKKEKALRNQAYARKFRKRASTGRTNRRSYGDNNSAQDSDEMEQGGGRDGAEESVD